jgi:hypothetical protein
MCGEIAKETIVRSVRTSTRAGSSIHYSPQSRKRRTILKINAKQKNCVSKIKRCSQRKETINDIKSSLVRTVWLRIRWWWRRKRERSRTMNMLIERSLEFFPELQSRS